ncbi:DUF3426 domain-containing protein [Phenylobacterium sp. J367]|uniref:DUF3426 domain-containing protein n=1 Tax=Phenylobacterium sp. J367 TaxID=2898435 RepID=UPI002151AF38|nr:DUF3426 domain-containing protein [Phenylobacterium sp. J367]MCR5877200.1 zinc-ribbon domain-containing protein [Phenylobacterium sp. J367]
MILTCPECATSYFVDDSRIPEGGRTVKCTGCGARWHTAREAEPVVDPEDRELFEDVAAEAAPEPEAPVAAAPQDDLEVSGPDPAERPRPRAAPRPPPPKKPVGAIIAWGSVAAVAVLLVAAALIFRDAIVRLAPQTSGAYAGLGVPVNSLGLVIEEVVARPTFQGGRPVLAVTGQIRNLREDAAQAPAIRIDMLSRTGQPLAAKVVRPIDPHVPGGSKRHFAVAIADPPLAIAELALAFEARAGQAGPAPVHAAADSHGAPAHGDGGHGAQPEEAKPLPADAPDALSDHHG